MIKQALLFFALVTSATIYSFYRRIPPQELIEPRIVTIDQKISQSGLWLRRQQKRAAQPTPTQEQLDHTLLRAVGLNSHKKAHSAIEAGASLQATDEHGNTPLIFATLHGDEAMVRLLLEYNSPIEARNKDGDSALDIATQRRKFIIASLILEAFTKSVRA